MANESIPMSAKAGSVLTLLGLIGTIAGGAVFFKNHPELDWKENGLLLKNADFSNFVTDWGAAEWGVASLVPLVVGFFIMSFGFLKAGGGHDHHHDHHH